MDNKDEIIIMLEGGMSVTSVANELGVSEGVVYRQASALIDKLRYERNKFIVAAYKAEWPVHTICDKSDVSIGTLYTVLRKYGVPLRRTRKVYPSDVDVAIVQMYEQGHLLHLIRVSTGASLTYIYRVLDTNKVPRRRSPSPPNTTDVNIS